MRNWYVRIEAHDGSPVGKVIEAENGTQAIRRVLDGISGDARHVICVPAENSVTGRKLLEQKQ